MTDQQQLELSLAGSKRGTLTNPPGLRQQRAQWWFEQMRQVVEHALEWEPTPRFATEQILFPSPKRLTRR